MPAVMGAPLASLLQRGPGPARPCASRLLRPAARRAPGLRPRAVESSGPSSDFNLAEYFEAKVEDVGVTVSQGHVIVLRILAAQGSALQLPIYIGAFESEALTNELHRSHIYARPATHDFMKNAILTLGYRVSKVAITSLRDNTYLGCVHFTIGRDRRDANFKEVVLDARPSDAINLAVRFNAPVYVNKGVARKMATLKTFPDRQESHAELRRSCRLQARRYQDPACVLKLQQQVAVAEERYDDAARLRDEIDALMAKDRLLSLLVAMETALEDHRFEEAGKLRDEFKVLQDTLAEGFPASV